MPERFQYVVVRYVPNIVRDEGVNVGIIIRAIEGTPFAFKFLPRSATVRKLWPEADQRLVGNFAHQLSAAAKKEQHLQGLGHPAEPGFFIRARAEFNGNLQLTEPRGILDESIEDALHEVYESFVAEPGGGPRPINYQSIAPYQMRYRLWSAFERRKLLGHHGVKKQMVLQGKHAPWTFDIGYRNRSVSLINSVALNAPSVETNLGRALVFKGMLDDVREEHQRIRATAVVQLSRGGEAVGAKEAQEILLDARAKVVEISNIAGLLDTVEKELSKAGA